MKVIDITKSCMAVALIALGAQITINLGIIPFTLQVFVLALLGHILNKKQIALTLSTYIFIGLLGIPVFSNFGSGLIMISKPSFGFIIGFIPFTFLIRKHKFYALLSLYSIGLTYLIFILKVLYQSDAAIPYLMIQYGLLFIPTDLIAIYLSQRIGQIMPLSLRRAKPTI